jgi:hypothetical protein
VSLSSVLWTFRILVFVLPVLFGAFTYKLCHDLERHRHAARVAESAEVPIARNDELESEPDRSSERAQAPGPP